MRPTRRRFLCHSAALVTVPTVLLRGEEPTPSAPADKPATQDAEKPKRTDMEIWLGLWVQEDSGGVMEFRADGKIIGEPVGGSFSFPEPQWIEIKSGPETLRCRWMERKEEPDALILSRYAEGEADAIIIRRLHPTPLNFKKWKGRCVVRHLIANGKTATNRSVMVEESGHFRTVEGGFYLRLLEGPNGGVLAYGPEDEDETINVHLYGAGHHLVVFDRLEKPRLFASCLFIDKK